MTPYLLWFKQGESTVFPYVVNAEYTIEGIKGYIDDQFKQPAEEEHSMESESESEELDL